MRKKNTPVDEKRNGHKSIMLRLSGDTIRRLDALNNHPLGIKYSHTELVRALFTRKLDEIERGGK